MYLLNFFQKKMLAEIFLGSVLLSAVHPATAQLDDQMSKAAIKHFNERAAKVPIYDDPELAAYVEKIGQKVAAVSDEPKTKFRFFVRDSPDSNAEAADYDLIYIDRGLLSNMTSEGQLAAVIAHEIGHRTGNHSTRLKRKHRLGNLAEFLASVMVGNSGVGRAMDAANTVELMSFKREVELEADELGAKYLYAAGYEPLEMLGMLSILADQRAMTSKLSGIDTAVYHGLLGTHPRMDKRLKAAIERAGVLPPGENRVGREEFRAVLDGVVYGANYTANKRSDQDRYVNKKLGITFVHPKDWGLVIKGNKIVLKDFEKTIQLKISIEKTQDRKLSSQQVIEAKYPEGLSELDRIDPDATRDLGVIAKHLNKRVAVIQVGRNTFHFQGIAKNSQLSKAQDQEFLEIIKSFRRATREDLLPRDVVRIYFKRLEPGETFASLAKEKILGKNTEDYLRVINGYYPKGEAEPGTYIKLIRSTVKADGKTKAEQ